LSNIFNSMAKYFGPKEHAFNPEVYQPRQNDPGQHLIVLGYSVIYVNPKSESHVNNFDNL
jgi:hypothetical protein